MNQLNSGFGGRIKRCRHILRLSAKALGNSVGVSDVTILNYEKESRVPSAVIFEKMAVVLATSPEYLMTGLYERETKSKKDTLDVTYDMSRKILTDENDLADLEQIIIDFVEKRIKLKLTNT